MKDKDKWSPEQYKSYLWRWNQGMKKPLLERHSQVKKPMIREIGNVTLINNKEVVQKKEP